MKRTIRAALAACMVAVALYGCSNAAKKTTVSQSELSAGMLQNIIDDGNAACGGDNALKGIEWYWNTAPGGLLGQNLPSGLTLIGGAGDDHARAAVRRSMQSLGDKAPKVFEFESRIYDEVGGGGMPATYVCDDGTEQKTYESHSGYLFVP